MQNVGLTFKHSLKYTVVMSRRQAVNDVFAVIADPTRRAILQQLQAGEQPVMALAAHFDMTLSAISQHLRILREVDLVTMRKEGREHVYRLNAAPLQTVAEWVGRYEPFWSDRLAALETYLERAAAAKSPGAKPGPDDTREERP